MTALTLGVIADTHVPDRSRTLSPAALEVFARARVDVILHAGDVIHPRVLAALEEIAPVYAVRGNRDFYFLRRLPPRRQMTFGGVAVGMWHGHGTWRQYWQDKWEHWRRNIPFERFALRSLRAFPDAEIVIFGHTHHPVCRWVGARLLCNPGSPAHPAFPHLPRAVGLVHIRDGRFWGELRLLPR